MANTRAEKVQERTQQAAPDETLFEDAFENAPHAMAVLTSDGSVIRANRSLCQMLRFTRAELEQLDCADIVHPDDFPTECGQRRRLATADIGRYELVLRCVPRDGAPIWVRLAVSAALRTRGKPAHLVAGIETVAPPISPTRTTSANNWPERFEDAALTAVHEIGNCLTPLMVNTELILEQSGKKELRESAHQIFKAARRIAFTLRRLRAVEDRPAVAYVGENRMLDLRMLAPAQLEPETPDAG